MGVDLDQLIDGLTKRFGRLPTEDEVHGFIFGTPDERSAIWNNSKEQDHV